MSSGSIVLQCGCEQEIKGVINEERILEISEIDMVGEGSGIFFDWILIPAFEESTGTLEAAIVWEDGKVERLIIKDGKVTNNEVEL
jgi:hypothetical protein